MRDLTAGLRSESPLHLAFAVSLHQVAGVDGGSEVQWGRSPKLHRVESKSK